MTSLEQRCSGWSLLRCWQWQQLLHQDSSWWSLAVPMMKRERELNMVHCVLSGPKLRNIAILSLRYPISRDAFSRRQGGQHSPKMVRYPLLALSFTQAHLCDTLVCNLSRDACAIPHKNKHHKHFAIIKLQVLQDMQEYHCCAS